MFTLLFYSNQLLKTTDRQLKRFFFLQVIKTRYLQHKLYNKVSFVNMN